MFRSGVLVVIGFFIGIFLPSLAQPETRKTPPYFYVEKRQSSPTFCTGFGVVLFPDDPRVKRYEFTVEYFDGQAVKYEHKKIKGIWDPTFYTPPSRDATPSSVPTGFLARRISTNADGFVGCSDSPSALKAEFEELLNEIEIVAKYNAKKKLGIEGKVLIGSPCYQVTKARVTAKGPKNVSLSGVTNNQGYFFLRMKNSEVKKLKKKAKAKLSLSVSFTDESQLVGSSFGDTLTPDEVFIHAAEEAGTSVEKVLVPTKKNKTAYRDFKLAGCGDN